MLDENLPAFFLRPSQDGVKHHRSFYLSHHGSDPEPAYALHHADPASPSANHKNCYAAALFDAYTPDVLFGEVLARPLWNQPTLSQEEIRRNGGVPPPPQPSLPHEFFVQLYNPDQQIKCAVKEGKWGSSDSYEFSMPETSFRTPSASNLDKGADDPSSLAITPKIIFTWRKESKLSKDLTCYMTGKSTDTEKKKSRKDPDIAIALWRSLRELTIYESNLGRVDIEDPKGLEVVLLLSAVVIKDLYLSSKDRLHETFNVSSAAGGAGGEPRKLTPRKTSSPPLAAAPAVQPPLPAPTPNDLKRSSLPRLQTTPPNSHTSSRPPPLDPRAQWALDAETARLRSQADAESRALARRAAEREKAAEAERRRLQRVVAEEEREAARRRREEVERETERLRRLYGSPAPVQKQQGGPRLGSNGLYVNPGASSSSVFMSGGNQGGLRPPGQGQAKPQKKKSSFFGLRSSSDDAAGAAGEQRRLAKKGSAMW